MSRWSLAVDVEEVLVGFVWFEAPSVSGATHSQLPSQAAFLLVTEGAIDCHDFHVNCILFEHDIFQLWILL